MRYLFGEHSFETATRTLRRHDTTLQLPPKAHLLLEVLLSEHPRVVTHEELHRRLWPEVHVTDASLARVVSELRSALGESAEGARLVRTAHRVGYSIGAPVRREHEHGAEARFVLASGRRRATLHAGENLLGRDALSILPLEDDPLVSRRHCRIVVEGEKAWLEDLESKNGTFLRGARIASRAELSPGDVLGVGAARLVFGDAGSNASTETGVGADVVVGRFTRRTGSTPRG